MAYYNNPYTYNLGYYPQVMQPLVQPPMVYADVVMEHNPFILKGNIFSKLKYSTL